MEKIADSVHVVNGRYFADLSDAERQRQWQAERQAREAARAEEYRRTHCAYCNERLAETADVVVIGLGEHLHRGCAMQFEGWLNSMPQDIWPSAEELDDFDRAVA
jgi:hypothetical protein